MSIVWFSSILLFAIFKREHPSCLCCNLSTNFFNRFLICHPYLQKHFHNCWLYVNVPDVESKMPKNQNQVKDQMKNEPSYSNHTELMSQAFFIAIVTFTVRWFSSIIFFFLRFESVVRACVYVNVIVITGGYLKCLWLLLGIFVYLIVFLNNRSFFSIRIIDHLSSHFNHHTRNVCLMFSADTTLTKWNKTAFKLNHFHHIWIWWLAVFCLFLSKMMICVYYVYI